MKVPLLVLAILTIIGLLAVNYDLKDDLNGLEFANRVFKGQVEAQNEQMGFLIEEALHREATNKEQYFMISHFPFPGEPWTIEKYWVQEELWIALQSYSSRTAAEDVKAQLESRELKTRDLFR